MTDRDAHARHAQLVGANLRDHRTHAGLSQHQLGEQMDPPVRRNEVNAWENGRRAPDARNLERLAAALHCHWTDLYARRNNYA